MDDLTRAEVETLRMLVVRHSGPELAPLFSAACKAAGIETYELLPRLIDMASRAVDDEARTEAMLALCV